MSLDELLHSFMDAGRLKRARRVKDGEASIQEVSGSRTRALVKEYHVVVWCGPPYKHPRIPPFPVPLQNT